MDTNKSTKLDYDYENLFDTSISNLEEKEISDLLKFNKIDHHYVSKTIQSGNQFEVELYPVFSKKEINKYRIKKKPSKAYKKNLNEKNKRYYFSGKQILAIVWR